jgi:hypothetical protein
VLEQNLRMERKYVWQHVATEKKGTAKKEKRNPEALTSNSSGSMSGAASSYVPRRRSRRL